jgi:sialidase-1
MNARLVTPLCLLVLWPGGSDAAEPLLSKTDLFEAGKGGYLLYRIPGVVVTPKGTVLAYCEARKKTGGDWDAIDILLRRSADGGKTWDEPRTLVHTEKAPRNPVAPPRKADDDVTSNNPVAIVDPKSGVVHFLYCVEYARCYHMRSDDDGKTFGPPTDITPAFEKFRTDYPWKVVGIGPGHGICLRNGRLLVPVWLSTGTGGGAHRPSCLSVVYSDDQGKAWQRGDIVAVDPKPKNPNETVALQLHDGSVLLNIRHEAETRRRGVSVSADGATNWSPLRFDDGLPDPICFGSIVRLSEKRADEKNRILFCNPNDVKQRKNLTVRLSYDECATWPVGRVLETEVAGYSDLAVGPDGTIYCFFERGGGGGNAFRTQFLTLARFNLEWLSNGTDHLKGR